jgi:hypothetical protein
MRNKLAIVGSNPLTHPIVPWDDFECDFWVFNEAAQYDWCKRTDGVFQVHKRVRYRRKHNLQHSKHWEWLQKPHDFPIWMIDIDEKVPASVKYPLQEVIDKLNCEAKMFSSTMGYAIALGLFMEYDEISIYGIEVASGTEYQYQRDGLAYWVGFAQGKMGKKFIRKCGQFAFEQPLYGYEGGVYHTPEEFENRLAKLQVADISFVQAKNDAENALEFVYEKATEDADALIDAISAALNANIELGKSRGKIYENKRYLQFVKEMYDIDNMAYIPRSQFEIHAHEGEVAAEEHLINIYRVAGRMDYAFMALQQTKDPRALSQIRSFTQEHLKAGYDHGFHAGRHWENSQYIKLFDQRLLAAGEVQFDDIVDGGT